MIASAGWRTGPDAEARHDRGAPGRQPPRHSHRRRPGGRRMLLAVLAIQAILSLRLIWSNTAFRDEALYLWAGHLQWAGWLHGVPITPDFPSYFSGAPVIYPPVGAIGDSIGGLAGARLISLCFMLGATALAWSAARRLFDDRAAFFAAALFAGTAATQFLGAFATYDAMAVTLLAAAAWCAVRSGPCRRRSRLLLVGAAVALLVLANMTKYASVLWDPVVLALAGLAAGRYRGRASGIVTGLTAALITVAALASAVLLARPAYWVGIRFSTLERSPAGWSSLTVLRQAGTWIGVVAALAVAGAFIVTRARRDRALSLTCWVLAAAVLLAPAEQARIHTAVSLFKHVGYGGWFGAVIAGYAVAAVTRSAAGGTRRVLVMTSAAALVLLGVAGGVEAGHHYASWPGSAALIAQLRTVIGADQGPALADDSAVPSYYLDQPGGRWTSAYYLAYTDPVTGIQLTGIPAYADAIRHGFFKIVVVGPGPAPASPTDRAIESDLRQNRGYRIAAVVPWSAGPTHGQYLIWHYQPTAGVRSVP